MGDYANRNVSFDARGFRRDDMEHFVAVLQELGLNVRAEFSASGLTAHVEARDLPGRFDAKVARTRNAGRRSTGIHPPRGSIFNYDTPCTEFLEWQKSHSAAEGMEQLGLTRSTYFRRIKQIREKVAEQERINRARDKSPKWEGKPRLSVHLGDVR